MQTDLEITVAQGRRIHAHLATPDTDGPAPGVLVIHELLGLNDDIRRIAGRFAEEGYVALAPDVFEGRGPVPLCVARTVRDVRRGHGPAVDDMLAARDWLAARPETDPKRIAVAGFCMGGGFALLLGTVGDFAAAAPYYGEVRPEAEAYRGICPVVGGWGRDDLVFRRQGDRLSRHLEVLGVPHDVVTYDGVGHSFMSQHAPWMMALSPVTPLRARYDEAAAEDSWRRMLAFFERYV